MIRSNRLQNNLNELSSGVFHSDTILSQDNNIINKNAKQIAIQYQTIQNAEITKINQ